ncbi:hypothetical protein GCM10009715_36560 [Paeniglutamicibacter psychrophenolicus]|uniref:Uncharacterized protein n=1 Tax=Paeniglutamicibacter psychrophenolicus TaxID=257454 RepID=A0ABS4WAN3_9MICC|nr:hypothetical protein [Paeniglutamicibacter psychrophenolicus]MBP2373243.1 hypothetical protein [Paeniglutamicibacter psychrophenolicus]
MLEFIRMELAADNVELTLPRDSYGADWRLTAAEPIIASRESEIGVAAELLGGHVRSIAGKSVPAGV